MEFFLQIWGGVFYLLAKIFLSKSEGLEVNYNWRLLGWIVYLIGIPAWVIVLALNRNWIALAVEAGGAPAIILGIILSIKQSKPTTNHLSNFVRIFTLGLVIGGILYSIYNLKGITTIKQLLETGVMTGFLIGTYLLAKKNSNGWLWFVLMNLSMGTLMMIQNKWIFAVLQIISLYFVGLSFLKAKYLLKVNHPNKSKLGMKQAKDVLLINR
jgi:hypothetical protein